MARLLLTAALLWSSGAAAQSDDDLPEPGELTLVRHNPLGTPDLYEGTTLVDDHHAVLAGVPDALSRYESYETMHTVGAVGVLVAFVGLAVGVTAIVADIGVNEDIGLGIIISSIVIEVGSITLLFVANAQADTAIEIYNRKRPRPGASLHLRLTL